MHIFILYEHKIPKYNHYCSLVQTPAVKTLYSKYVKVANCVCVILQSTRRYLIALYEYLQSYSKYTSLIRVYSKFC